jgi:hypothetical protein
VQQLTLFANFLPVSFWQFPSPGPLVSNARDMCEEHAISRILLWLLPEIAAGQCCQLFPLFSGQIGQKTAAEKKFCLLENKAALTEIVIYESSVFQCLHMKK